MAHISPICSMIVAKAMGTMAMMLLMRNVMSVFSRTASTVCSRLTGKPNHAASETFEKSTLPIIDATAYDTTTPSRIGTIFTMPRPQMLLTITVAMAMMARGQSVWQLDMAEPDSVRPMAMTIGPVTTGGKNRRTRFVPNHLISPAITK